MHNINNQRWMVCIDGILAAESGNAVEAAVEEEEDTSAPSSPVPPAVGGFGSSNNVHSPLAQLAGYIFTLAQVGTLYTVWLRGPLTMVGSCI